MVLAGFTSEHADPSLKHSRQSLSMVNECGNTESSKTKQMVITNMQGREIFSCWELGLVRILNGQNM